MQIHCRYCASEIPAENINLDKLLAKCANCKAVFSIAGEMGLAAGEKPKKHLMPSVAMPSRVTVDQRAKELRIVYKWFDPTRTMPLILFAVLVDGFVIVWYGIALSTGQSTMLICGSFHLLFGLLLTYWVASHAINETTITVTPRHLDIKHRPIPARLNKTLLAGKIAQVYSKEDVQSGRRSTRITYSVVAILNNERDEVLLTGLENVEQALYIEHEIERYLGIEDQWVSGEVAQSSSDDQQTVSKTLKKLTD